MEDNLCFPELDRLFLLEIKSDLSDKERDEEDIIWLCLMMAGSCAYLDVTIHFAIASSSCKCCTELFPSLE